MQIIGIDIGGTKCAVSVLRDGAPGKSGSLVRFSIGLEEVDDLIADAQQALGVLAA